MSREYFESVNLTINQPDKGFRYGPASLALSKFARVRSSDVVADLGSGCAVIACIVAARDKPSKIFAVEIQQSFHEIGLFNVKTNGLDLVVECVNEDFVSFSTKNEKICDVVVSNPPFYSRSYGRISVDEKRAIAHHGLNKGLGDIVKSAQRLLKVGGNVFFVFPRDRALELVREAAVSGLKEVEIEKRDEFVGDRKVYLFKFQN